MRKGTEKAQTAADPAQSASQAMMGADLGHLCALRHGDGHRELSCGHWRMRAVAGVRHEGPGVRMVHRDKMGAVRRPDNRDRELEVMAVEAGAGRAAFLPVMCAGPSGAAR